MAGLKLPILASTLSHRPSLMAPSPGAFPNQASLPHSETPCLCLHGTLTAHTLSYEDACWGPAPGSREASSAPDFLPTFTPCKAFRLDSLTVLSFHIYQEICRNASSTCLCSHLHFWLPGCLNLAPRLSHLEVNCSDSQLYICPFSPPLSK